MILLVALLAFADPAPAAPAAPPVKEKKICRTEVATGSIMPKRICHTDADWKSIDDDNASNADRFNRERSMSRSSPTG